MDAFKAVMSRFKALFVARLYLALEFVALHQQLEVLKRSGKRPELRPSDRLFWVLLSTLWPDWRSALVIVKPETVNRWRRQGFRLFQFRKPRSRKPGRPPINAEIRKLIRRMSRENGTWGAPRIESELRLLGYAVAERTVAKYMARTPRQPTQTWRTFLRNHVIGMTDIDVLKACNSTLHHFCHFAILPHVLRWTCIIRTAMTGWTAACSSDEASTVVFGGYDRPSKHSVRRNHGANDIEECPPVLSSEPGYPLLRFNSTRFRERGPPGKDDWNLTSDEREANRITASAA